MVKLTPGFPESGQKVMDRFPNYQSLVESGFMLPQEAKCLAKLECK